MPKKKRSVRDSNGKQQSKDALKKKQKLSAKDSSGRRPNARDSLGRNLSVSVLSTKPNKSASAWNTRLSKSASG